MKTAEQKRQKWARIQSGLIMKILENTVEDYGFESIHEAYEEFMGSEIEEMVGPEVPEWPLFLPWFFYEWYPDMESSSDNEAPSIPPALTLIEHGDLSDDEKQYLQVCCDSSFSFFEILEVVPNQSMKLKDLLNRARGVAAAS